MGPIHSCSKACLRKKPIPRKKRTAPTRESHVLPRRPSHCPTPGAGAGAGADAGLGAPDAAGGVSLGGTLAVSKAAGAAAVGATGGGSGAPGVSRTGSAGAASGPGGHGEGDAAMGLGTGAIDALSPAPPAWRSRSSKRVSSRRTLLRRLRSISTRTRTMIGVAKKSNPSATSGTIGSPLMCLGCHDSARTDEGPRNVAVWNGSAARGGRRSDSRITLSRLWGTRPRPGRSRSVGGSPRATPGRGPGRRAAPRGPAEGRPRRGRDPSPPGHAVSTTRATRAARRRASSSSRALSAGVDRPPAAASRRLSTSAAVPRDSSGRRTTARCA